MMSDEKRQYSLSVLGWLNILVLSPIIFLTIIGNAQRYVLQMRTDRAIPMLILYGVQIVLLCYLFIPAVLLQMKRDKQQTYSLSIMSLTSMWLLGFIFLNIARFQQVHIYGGVLFLFLQSYVGIGLFLLNSCVSSYLFVTKQVKFYINKSMFVLLFSFLCLTIVLYILK